MGALVVTTLSVTGAAGFLGRHFIAATAASGFDDVRALAHRTALPEAHGVPTVVHGDLLDAASLASLCSPGGLVVHMAYLKEPTAKANLIAARNLVAACARGGVRRLVYCSTAVVVGRAPDDVVTELTACFPATAYERTKLEVEREILEGAAGQFEVTVLRPTAVFGPGGRNLVALARRVIGGGRLAAYLKASLEGERRMNLVSVHNVTAALLFLATTHASVDGQVFIISDDETPMNNYRDLELWLRRRFGRPGLPLPLLPVAGFLPRLLAVRGRSGTNPRRRYAWDKLKAAGLHKAVAFEDALTEFADWFLAASHHART